jgi:transcriptional regulator with XRE-family HTH domain
MAEQTGKLTNTQERAITALLTEKTQAEAAAKAGVNESTVSRWLREPAFAEALQQARRDLVSVAIGRLQEAAATAVTTLKEIAEDKAQLGSARVSAAKTILETAFKAQELQDIEDRLTALEVMTK